MSFTIEDAPQDFLDGLDRDRARGKREESRIKDKLLDLEDELDHAGRPSKEESLASLMVEARRLGIAC